MTAALVFVIVVLLALPPVAFSLGVSAGRLYQMGERSRVNEPPPLGAHRRVP